MPGGRAGPSGSGLELALFPLPRTSPRTSAEAWTRAPGRHVHGTQQTGGDTSEMTFITEDGASGGRRERERDCFNVDKGLIHASVLKGRGEHGPISMGTGNPLMQASPRMPVMSRITRLVNNPTSEEEEEEHLYAVCFSPLQIPPG
ncbi:unnamed protein product [Pleuronectes platessa]|uniref:Uncharacterized protein n=1 Tax=Pleuronectes platessa TaxID=8262 RepID=A0A9N7UH13_PLEPL|nr:unnamed protein product [Pleuronectes platessa]